MPRRPQSVNSLRKEFIRSYPYFDKPREVEVPAPIVEVVPPVDPRKSLAMRLIEAKFNRPIEELLDCSKTLEVVAKELGIDFTLVSKWRKKLGLRK